MIGAAVYDAAYVLAEYLERHPELVNGNRVLELGAGPGLVGIVAGLLGAEKVIVTDGDETVVELAQRNIDDVEKKVDFAGSVSAKRLLW